MVWGGHSFSRCLSSRLWRPKKWNLAIIAYLKFSRQRQKQTQKGEASGQPGENEDFHASRPAKSAKILQNFAL
jgi:hypothetical protein